MKDGIFERPVKLILGFSTLEWKQTNCDISLYSHGQLIGVSSY